MRPLTLEHQICLLTLFGQSMEARPLHLSFRLGRDTEFAEWKEQRAGIPFDDLQCFHKMLLERTTIPSNLWWWVNL